MRRTPVGVLYDLLGHESVSGWWVVPISPNCLPKGTIGASDGRVNGVRLED